MHPLDAAGFWVRLLSGSAAGLVTWAACWCIGVSWLDKCLPTQDRLTRRALGAAFGFAVVASMTAILGLFDAEHYGAYGVVAGLLVAIAVGIKRSMTSAVKTSKIGLLDPRALRFSDWLALAAIGLAVFTGIVAAALPAVWWDPIAYHLPIVERALRVGAFAFDPAMTQSGFPLLGEAGALPAYAIAGSAGPAFVTLGAGVVLALLCGAVANRFEPKASLLAVALVAASPLWMWLSPSFYVDVPFAMFAVGAIAAPLLFDKAGDRGPWVGLLCGALAGAAAAVKIPGIATAFVAAIVLLSANGESRGRRLAWFALAFCLVALPWYVRSYVLAGDPIYPFLSQWIGHAQSVRDFAVRYATMTRNWCGGGYSLIDAALAPWRMLTDPRRYCGDPGYALRLGTVFFLAGFAAVKRIRPIAAIAAVLALLWFFESHQDRFVLPALCFFAIAVAVGAVGIGDRLGKAAAFLLASLSIVAVLANWLPALESEASNSIVPAFSYIAGSQSGPQYLHDRLETYAADQWLGFSRGPVLALDDVRDYYSAASVWGNPYYQPVWNLDWTVPSSVRYSAVARIGIRYLIVNANPAYVGRTPTGIDWQVLSSDVRSGALRVVFEHERVMVLELSRI